MLKRNLTNSYIWTAFLYYHIDMETKTCARCKEPRSLNEFFKNASRRDGVSGFCKICHQQDVRMRYIKDRMIVINAYGGKCEKCGFQDFRALQFDHVQGGGSKDLKGKSPTAIRKALMPVNKEKFALLCANCNWKRRYTDKQLHKNLPKLQPVDADHTPSKECKRCLNRYDTKDFYKNKGRHDGLSVYCKECHNTDTGHRSASYRTKVFNIIGEVQCKKCGESDLEVLHVDHINGGGNKHRKEHNSPDSYWNNIKTLDPSIFQILCANCNLIKVWDSEEKFKK